MGKGGKVAPTMQISACLRSGESKNQNKTKIAKGPLTKSFQMSGFYYIVRHFP